MLNLLRGPDDRNVSDRRVGHVLDRIGSFRDKAVDDLTGLSSGFADVTLQQYLDLPGMYPGFFQVSPEGRNQIGVRGLLNQAGQCLDNLLLHIKGLLEVVDVEST